MHLCSCPLVSSSLDLLERWRWGGVNASLLVSVRFARGSSRLHHYCCSCSLLQEKRYQMPCILFNICSGHNNVCAVNLLLTSCIIMLIFLTFRQFPFARSGWLGLLTPDGGPSTADPTDDGHCVIVPSSLQGIPVGDEWQPAVLSLQSHLKCHETLQVHVTVEVRMKTVSFSHCLTSIVFESKSLHILWLRLTLFSCPVELVCWRTHSGYPKTLDSVVDPPPLEG